MNETIQQAFRDWNERRAYVDNGGNYRLRPVPATPTYRPNGKIAPWNREVKQLFSSCHEFHAAAQASGLHQRSKALVELRDRLRALGYDARLVNGDCFDIHQDGRVHYLSREEAETLNRGGLDLAKYSERRGLNYWYSFNQTETRKADE